MVLGGVVVGTVMGAGTATLPPVLVGPPLELGVDAEAPVVEVDAPDPPGDVDETSTRRDTVTFPVPRGKPVNAALAPPGALGETVGAGGTVAVGAGLEGGATSGTGAASPVGAPLRPDGDRPPVADPTLTPATTERAAPPSASEATSLLCPK